MFAVVRDVSAVKSFVKWHETEDEAVAESKRLAAKENATFFVVRVIGKSMPAEPPVVYQYFGPIPKET